MRDVTSENGFTLSELLVASAIFALVMVGAFSLVTGNHNAYRRGMVMAETQQQARVALQRMSRDLRMAGYDLSGVLAGLTSPTPIQAADTSSLTFVADVTGDGVLDRITYRLEGTDLMRDLSSWNGSSFPTATSGGVASSVGLLSISYFDDTSPTNLAISAPVPTAKLADIRRIRIGIVTSESMVNSSHTFPMVMDVRVRNWTD